MHRFSKVERGDPLVLRKLFRVFIYNLEAGVIQIIQVRLARDHSVEGLPLVKTLGCALKIDARLLPVAVVALNAKASVILVSD